MATIAQLRDALQRLLAQLQAAPAIVRPAAIFQAGDNTTAPLTRSPGIVEDAGFGVDERGREFTLFWPESSYDQIGQLWQEVRRAVGGAARLSPDHPFATSPQSVNTAIAVIQDGLQGLDLVERLHGLQVDTALQPAQSENGFPTGLLIAGGLLAVGLAVVAGLAAAKRKNETAAHRAPIDVEARSVARPKKKRKKASKMAVSEMMSGADIQSADSASEAVIDVTATPVE